MPYRLTHPINTLNPKGEQVTLDTGVDLPKWAVEKLQQPDQPAHVHAALVETQEG